MSTFKGADFLIILAIILGSSKFVLYIAPLQFVELILTLLGFYFVGNLFIKGSEVVKNMPPLIVSALNIILGGFFYTFILVFSHSLYIKYVLYLLGLLNFIGPKDWKIDKLGLTAISPFLLFLFSSKMQILASRDSFINVGGDFYYYTAIVQSIASNWNIMDAIFHTDIPINYQSLTFFFPAAFTYNLGIQAHHSLWAVAMPLFAVFSFGTISSALFFLLKKQNFIAPNKEYKIQLFISFSLILLAPLNPLYLLKLDYKNFIFLGEGYLLPLGSPGFALSLWLFGVCIFFIFISQPKWYDKFLFSVFCASIIAMKLAFFIPMFIFMSFYLGFPFLKGRLKAIRNLIPLIISLIIAVVLYVVFFGQSDGLQIMKFTTKGYYYNFLKEKALQYGFQWSPSVFLGILSYMILIWMGLKSFLIFVYFKNRSVFDEKFRLIFLSLIFTVFLSALPSFFISVFLVDGKGVFLQDLSFDMGQFLRSGWFIANTFSILLLVILFFGSTSNLIDKSLKIFISVWFLLVGISFFVQLIDPINPKENSWYQEVVSDYKEVNPYKMAMKSNGNYSGQMLVAKGVYPWWVCTKRADNSGYVMTNKVNYRNEILYALIDSTTSIDSTQLLLNKMKQEGVDYLVSTPDYDERLKSLVQNKLLIKSDRSNWFYKIP
ncbi:MAG: hypothetical protein R2828_04020 [Saprospiraceae bacterium]